MSLYTSVWETMGNIGKDFEKESLIDFRQRREVLAWVWEGVLFWCSTKCVSLQNKFIFVLFYFWLISFIWKVAGVYVMSLFVKNFFFIETWNYDSCMHRESFHNRIVTLLIAINQIVRWALSWDQYERQQAVACSFNLHFTGILAWWWDGIFLTTANLFDAVQSAKHWKWFIENILALVSTMWHYRTH